MKKKETKKKREKKRCKKRQQILILTVSFIICHWFYYVGPSSMVALVIYVTWSIFIVQLRNDTCISSRVDIQSLPALLYLFLFSFFFADMEQCTKPTTVWRGLYGCSSILFFIFCPSGSVCFFFLWTNALG